MVLDLNIRWPKRCRGLLTIQAGYKKRHLQASDVFYFDILLLFDEPIVIFAAVKDIFYIDFIILNLVKDKVPFLNKHLVIFIWRNIQFLKEREPLWHLA